MTNDVPAWANARNRADFMSVAATESGAGDILLRNSYSETKTYYVSNSPLHFQGEATRSETETHRSRLGNRSWADEVYREALDNASPWTVLYARKNMQDKPYYAEYRAQALQDITNDRFAAQTLVTFANLSRMQPDEIETVQNIVATNPEAAGIVFGQDPNGGYSRRGASEGAYSPEIFEAAARTMVESDPRMAQVLARDARYASYFEEAGLSTVPAAGAAVAPSRPDEPVIHNTEVDGRASPILASAQTRTEAQRLGIDGTDGYDAVEKQKILEASGFATDKGGADGRVDGQYGSISRRAEQNFSRELVAGNLAQVDPSILAAAREAFSSSITDAQNFARGEAVNPSTAADVAVDSSRSAAR